MAGMAPGADNLESAAFEEPPIGGKRDPDANDKTRKVLSSRLGRRCLDQLGPDAPTSP